MLAYLFNDSGEAYDATQCRDELAENGHALVIPSEGVVGLSYTWPVAVTAKQGQLHNIRLSTAETFVHEFGTNKGERVFSDAVCALAVRYALDLGLEIDTPFAGFIESALALEAPPAAEELDWGNMSFDD